MTQRFWKAWQQLWRACVGAMREKGENGAEGECKIARAAGLLEFHRQTASRFVDRAQVLQNGR
ncbi:hypothetical protein B7486_19355 [cyanobacterium TDX16]|nr:hypothetical protein B7486_19355 [cyanobacterium TDX16]